MILMLPVTNDPAQEFVTQLGDAKYSFEIKFNDVSGIWTMDIANPISNTPILMGIPLLLGTRLLEPYNLNMGSMAVYDTSIEQRDAGPDDLGNRIWLLWWDDEEDI